MICKGGMGKRCPPCLEYRCTFRAFVGILVLRRLRAFVVGLRETPLTETYVGTLESRDEEKKWSCRVGRCLGLLKFFCIDKIGFNRKGYLTECPFQFKD
ncbi:hypothetical protein TNIN_13171 [Trichonephila inaurata madagascariensis]|uniref:Uncharacterized protein n=1 Tax=Trichonephila inaurata madagascariensis TaxID=2747483 RepID=A0A8X7BV43_9ARAC|nr:hypothetical protein TNIN_13171 [Trichonephila inaurata madagascariensis]